MATTANYGWTKPTVLGDVGAWGTIANTLFDAVDTQVKNRQNEAAQAQTDANIAKAELIAPPMFHPLYSYFGTPSVNWSLGTNGAIGGSGSGVQQDALTVILNPYLKVGQKIVTFNARGSSNLAACVGTATLYTFDDQFPSNQVNLGSVNFVTTGTDTTVSPANFNHVVVANKQYILVISYNRSSGSGTLTWRWATLSLSR